jgi:hypothetical protein
MGQDADEQPSWGMGGNAPAQMIAPAQVKLCQIEIGQLREENSDIASR